MRGHKVCFYAKIREIFPKQTLLPFLIRRNWCIFAESQPELCQFNIQITSKNNMQSYF